MPTFLHALNYTLRFLNHQIIGANPAWEGNGFRMTGNACYVLCSQSCIDFAKVQEDARIQFDLSAVKEEGNGDVREETCVKHENGVVKVEHVVKVENSVKNEYDDDVYDDDDEDHNDGDDDDDDDEVQIL